jgi:hypothetical protein
MKSEPGWIFFWWDRGFYHELYMPTFTFACRPEGKPRGQVEASEVE